MYTWHIYRFVTNTYQYVENNLDYQTGFAAFAGEPKSNLSGSMAESSSNAQVNFYSMQVESIR